RGYSCSFWQSYTIGPGDYLFGIRSGTQSKTGL
ncbi:uncharacterized protein METZ01_LOCUS145010, partial [marine metagenome]